MRPFDPSALWLLDILSVRSFCNLAIFRSSDLSLQRSSNGPDLKNNFLVEYIFAAPDLTNHISLKSHSQKYKLKSAFLIITNLSYENLLNFKPKFC